MPFYEEPLIKTLRERAVVELPVWESPFCTDDSMFYLMRIISMTPTSPLRNEITEINIQVLALEEKIRAA